MPKLLRWLMGPMPGVLPVGGDYAGNRHTAGASHGASILLESGSYLLMEDGTSSFLLE